jgi:hypothetical protein
MKVVVIEKRPAGGGIRREALELVAKARDIGECTIVEFSGPRITAAGVAAAVAPKLRDADLVLVPGTPAGRDVAEHVARALGRDYVSDATDLASISLPAVASVPLGAFPLAADAPMPQVIAVEVGNE